MSDPNILLPTCQGACFSDGGLAGLVFGCIFGTLVLGTIAAVLLWRIKGRKERQVAEKERRESDGRINGSRKGVEEGENGYTNGAYLGELSPPRIPNPLLTVHGPDSKDFTDIGLEKTKPNGHARQLDTAYAGLHKRKGHAKEHSYSTESLSSIHEIVSVALKSQDHNGLGFNVRGNMREGIFVKDVMPRGPAGDAGNVEPGDRILSVKVSFENMVFEDALTILSYASPYNVSVELLKTHPSSTKQAKRSDYPKRYSQADLEPAIPPKEKRPAQVHPLFKSHSVDDMELSAEKLPSQKVSSTPTAKDARRTKSAQPHTLLSTTPEKRGEKESNKLSVPGAIFNAISDSERNPSGRSSALSDRPKSPRYHTPNRSHAESASGSSEKSIPDSVYLSDAKIGKTNSAVDPYQGLSPAEKLEVLRLSYEDSSEIIPPQNTPMTPPDISSKETSAKTGKVSAEKGGKVKSPGERMPKLTKFKQMLSSGNSSSERESKSPDPQRGSSSPPKEKLSAKKALTFSDLSLKSESEDVDETGFKSAIPWTEDDTDGKELRRKGNPSRNRPRTRSYSPDESSESSEPPLPTSKVPPLTLSPPSDIQSYSDSTMQSPSEMTSTRKKTESDSYEPPPDHPIRTYLDTKSGLKPAMEQSNWLRPKGLERQDGEELDEGDFEEEQYEKLLYFQRQLAIQHEELTKMGIAIPMSLDPVGKVNSTPITNAKESENVV